MSYLSEDSPQARSLKAKIVSLEDQIAEQKTRVTGDASNIALNALNAEYKELLFNVELATLVYETSVSSYELARNQASRKFKHLLVPSKPRMAANASYPERAYWRFTLYVISLSIYGCVILVIKSVREHFD